MTTHTDQRTKRRAAACQDYLAGLTAGEVAKKYNMSHSAVRVLLQEYRVPMRKTGPQSNPEDHKKVVELHDSAGLTWAEIGRKLGISSAEATRRYNAVKADSMRPKEVACPLCEGHGKIHNPEKIYETD